MNGCNFYCSPVADNNTNQTDSTACMNYITNNNSNYIIAKAGSVASNTYWREEDKDFLQNITPVDGPSVTLSNNSILKSNEEGRIPLSPLLSSNAKKASIIPGLMSSSLISLGQIVDDNCTIILDKKKLIAIKNKDIVLSGIRNFNDGLWDIPVHKKYISPVNCTLLNIHALIYPTRSQNKCDLKSSPTSKKVNNLTIKHIDNFLHLDRIVNEQLKEEEK